MLVNEDCVSKELLEREEQIRKRNEELSLKVKSMMEETEQVVKKGEETLHRPKTAPTLQDIPKKTIKPKIVPKEMKEDYPDVFMGLGVQENEIGSEAASRFLKAKTHVLQKELEELVKEKKTREKEFQLLQEKVAFFDQARVKEQKEFTSLSSQYEKVKTQNAEMSTLLQESKVEIQRLKKELDQVCKSTKLTDQESHQKDVKLQRSLEEIEKVKQSFAAKESHYKEIIHSTKKQCEQLFQENKRLLKQKQDLLQGFKKQNQLIDVIKRQKLHIEATRILEFTEDEFMKALQID